MGLDQYAQGLDREFYWRKHARLQAFMSKEHNKQYPKFKSESDLGHLGFNGGDGDVIITDKLLDRLEEAIKNGYWDYFATDGFFWGQQFQEESVKENKKYDKLFLKFCKNCLKKGEIVEYSCSW